MSNRTALWNLLIERKDQWISRADLLFVGGTDAPRRMRDIKEDIVRSGQYVLEERTVTNGVIEYRLVELPPIPDNQNQRFLWRCMKCGAHPADYMRTTNTIDPRWRMGKCAICGDKSSIYGKVL